MDIQVVSGIEDHACGLCGWNGNGGLVLVDRWITDHPPIPRRATLLECYLGDVEPDNQIIECFVCGEDLPS